MTGTRERKREGRERDRNSDTDCFREKKGE